MRRIVRNLCTQAAGAAAYATIDFKCQIRPIAVNSSDALILGIESSCDETAAAVVAGGRRILSSVIASQVAIHRNFGGVVPELASREHLRRIVPVVREAVEQAGVALPDVDAIAVTQGPGLIGALLVGVTYGKVLALALGKPLIAVNHLEGHVHAVLLEAHAAGRRPELPAVCLIVSGGHTILYHVKSDSPNGAARFSYARIGGTRDDAAGEAYDKVARMLALGYPGGPIIDQLAGHGNAKAIRFAEPKMKRQRFTTSASAASRPPCSTTCAAIRSCSRKSKRGNGRSRAANAARKPCASFRAPATLDLVASFQRAVVDDLVGRTLAAAAQTAVRTVLVSGGVAANSELPAGFEAEARRRGIEVYFPSRALSTDNAAMIAAAGYPRFIAGLHEDSSLNAEANLPLA